MLKSTGFDLICVSVFFFPVPLLPELFWHVRIANSLITLSLPREKCRNITLRGQSPSFCSTQPVCIVMVKLDSRLLETAFSVLSF
ncbi:uncharacterized protein P174DRAFT_10840 [Aspergillus novofumigatus IBT 16806]|uniref:Uncharacterized protein n=1 Tax=Aspergillus novofumigatus (strain IBT 16806) TaxID=1392255 RepID=A0A2I1CKZ1_ASPN1|nr:uncharacterized protein P174DRAFT_10840 [Aspergillus novofumigatus IBT 16806]PKX98276.1 hypothetical protein P174DRAFT_10840 [Aspergillus novofumigatus IBT 16806]